MWYSTFTILLADSLFVFNTIFSYTAIMISTEEIYAIKKRKFI